MHRHALSLHTTSIALPIQYRAVSRLTPCICMCALIVMSTNVWAVSHVASSALQRSARALYFSARNFGGAGRIRTRTTY